MDDQVLPDVNVDGILNQIKSKSDLETKASLNPLVNKVDMNSGDGLVKEQTASASTSKSTTSAARTKKIHEFIRFLRPNLPRESKTKACKLMKSIAKGIIVETTIQRTFPKKKAVAKRVRKHRTKNSKRKSAVGLRRSFQSMYESSESCGSEGCRSRHGTRCRPNLCSRCGYSCSKIGRY